MELKSNHYYNFDTIAPLVIGSSYKNVKILISGITPEEAVKMDPTIVAINNNVFISSGETIVPHIDNTYFKVMDVRGNTYVLAESWIKPNTIEEITAINGATIVIQDNLSQETITSLRNIFSALGIRAFTIST